MRALLAVLLALLLAGCEAPTREPSGPTLVAFSSTNCAPCQRDKPRLQEIRDDGFQVTVIDTDRDPNTASQYGVRQTPTYIVYDGEGREVERLSDIWKAWKLLQRLRSLL